MSSAVCSATDGAELLDQVVRFVRRFVVFQQPEAADFLGLWVMHTHAFEAAITTPYVRVTSPERESGKTRTFEALAVLVRRPWLNAVVSTAILYRKGDRESPTLLLDEVDNIDFASRNELLGVLNSGYRLGIKVSRCDDKGGYRDFDPFFPKAFAGITGGKLPDTLHSRSVAVRLQRRRPEEPVERFFHHKADQDAAPLREALEQWSVEHLSELAGREPDLPDVLGDRAQEVWLPLIAIADVAGGDWPVRARRAAVALSGPEATAGGEESHGVRLLGDIRTVFADKLEPPVILTRDLVAALNASEELPWGGWNHGDGLRDRDLARLLSPFAVRPHSIKTQVQSQVKVARGYRHRQFEEPWSRYLGDERYQRYPATSAENTGDETPDEHGHGSGVAEVADIHGGSDDGSLFDQWESEFERPGHNQDGEEMPS